MDLVELSRRLENIVRVGTIHSVDHAAVRVRVQTGGLITQWLPWLEKRAGQTTTWDPPTVGEQCIVFSPSGEPGAGVVLVGLDSASIEPPSHSPDEHVTRYPDGAEIRYNHQTSHLEATGIITGLVQAATSITLDTPLTHITGQCVIDDLLTYNNGLAGIGGENGSVIQGPIQHTGTHTQTGGDLSSNGKVLHTHVHTGVQPGGSNTGAPA